MKLKSIALVSVIGTVTLMVGCSKPAPTPPKSTVHFDTSLAMAEFMGHVVDSAAFGFWKGSGTEETVSGTRELAPTTDAGWEALESSAAVLIEAGNMLQLPGRPRDPEGHWNKYAQDLSLRAAEGKAAAFKHDKQAVFETGAKIYQVCEACHAEYVIGPQIKSSGPATGDPLPPWPSNLPEKK
ncbi:MAG: hypothetical protein WCO83_03900 [Alphaproteobacteria bacterium]